MTIIDIKKQIELARKNFISSGCNHNILVNYLADNKTYHTLAIMIFSSITELDETSCKNYIYANKYYKDFENESNPFNDEFNNA